MLPQSPSQPDAASAALRALRQSPRRRVLFISHGWGGGVQRHMSDLAALVADACDVVALVPGPGGTVRLELGHGADAVRAYFALPAETGALVDLLRSIGVSRIHVHHVHGLPPAVLGLPEILGIAYDVTLHDYYAMDPRPVEEGGDASAMVDAASSTDATPWGVSLGEWRGIFGAFLRDAARVIAPSHDVARRYERVWPGLAMLVWPHPEAPSPPMARVARVVAPGRISPAKGLRVLAACALHARAHRLPLFFRVLGTTTEPLVQSPSAPLSVSGEYPDHALPALLAAEGPDVILLPTQAPETYGFVLSAAIATGVPIVASALGAYVERLAGITHATLLPADAAPAQWNDALLRAARIDLAPAPASPIATGSAPAEYRARYLEPVLEAAVQPGHEIELEQRYLKRPRGDPGVEPLSLTDLYRFGVECGQLEARRELQRRIDAIEEERAELLALRAAAMAEHQAAQGRVEQVEHALRVAHARIQEFEQSTSWRLTAPVRSVGHRWKLFQARFRATYATARHVPRQADIARTILRDHGAAALGKRVWAKLSGGRRFRPSVPTRYTQETAAGALAFSPMGPAAPRVSIVIPAFGDPLLTFTCLKSIVANTPAGRYEVIVVDDASAQPVADALCEVRGICIERNASNLGFIASCNRGAAIAQGDVLVFLNNDTIVTAGWLQAILQTFERRPRTGLVGAKLVYPDGRLQEAGGIVWRDGSAWNCGRDDDPDRPEHNYVREADYCSGACIAIPVAVFRAVGGFDTRYAPAYYEDTDLAFAVRAAGRKVVYQPRATVIHFEGSTAGTDVGSGMKQHQVVNQRRFAQKWAGTLAAHRANGVEPGLERDRWARHRVLVVDACMLTPDQDSGSVRMQAILELLLELDCKVTFVADSLEHREPYVSDLQQRGVEVLFYPYVRSIAAVLAERGAEFDMVVISRHYIASKHIGTVRTFAPRAVLVFDTVDLHFLRAERLAELEGNAMARSAAHAEREEELDLIRKSDVTLVVSDIEQQLLARIIPEAEVAVLSNIHEPIPGGKAYADRAGLVFIGGFQHPPNTDAVLWYAQQVLPHVRRLLPGVCTYIVGADAPASIRDLAAADFVVAGHVPDVAPYFTRCRVSVSPLRYGAGVKGKVNLALSYGVPVVATTPSVEGMHLTPGVDVLLADAPQAFAGAIARVYGDEWLWQGMSDAGHAVIRRHFSRDVARAALAALLERAHRRSAPRTSPELVSTG